MLPQNWDDELARALAVFYNGADIGKDCRGRTITDHNFLICFNSSDTSVTFTLPSPEHSPHWEVVIDTAGTWPAAGIISADEQVAIGEKPMLVLRAYTTRPKSLDRPSPSHLPRLTATDVRKDN